MNRTQKLIAVSAPEFAAFDTQLYLDTHPNDATAMAMFNNYRDQYMAAAKEYEAEFGPLMSENATNGMWKWIDNPWPWEGEAN